MARKSNFASSSKDLYWLRPKAKTRDSYNEGKDMYLDGPASNHSKGKMF
jgi:hypothetical protein